MKIEHLREFYILAENLNYTVASELQYITQPTLSKHISLLENELDLKLFNRNTRSVELTPAGIRLRDGLAEVFKHYDQTMFSLAEFRANKKNSLCVGFPAVPVTDYLGKVPQIMKERCPGIFLSFFSGDPESCIDAMLSGNADVVLIGKLNFPNSGKFIFHEIATENFVVICRSDDPIAGRESLQLEDLQELDFIRVGSVYNQVMWQSICSVAAAAGVSLSSSLTLNQMDPVLMSVRQGLGVAIVGKHQSTLAVNGLTAVEIKDPRLTRSLALAHSRTNFNPAIPEFIKVFESFGYGSENYNAE